MDQQMKPLSPYFSELSLRLSKEGYTVHIGETDYLSADWQGLPLCRITADGGVRYWQEDVATPERQRACERATDLACTVREYMTLLEQAPPLQAQSLTGDYRLLADFNGAVLAAHPTRLGVQFVTWDWSFDRTGLNQGNYFQENYAGAKQDFAIRAGLISKQQIFNQEQLIKANTDEIKAEQKEQRKTNTEFVTRLTAVEASAKQAHKRIDTLERAHEE